MKYFHQHPFEIHQACARACQGPTKKSHVTPNTDIFFLGLMIGKRKGAGASLLSNLAHIEMLHNNKMRITFIVMAAPWWTLICQSKSDYIQAIAQDIIKIWIFYIYMNIYLHVKVFIFVPRVDFNIIISHLSDNISYYKMFIHKHPM